ncbi:MAG TPA: AtpZ/AtpI family protein [Balneolaceae bacterium]|nr:AtpZ/AtpI family protein [Balneolaceae bacterium]
MDENKSSEDQKERFEQQVREKSHRKIKARRESKKGVWFGIGMFGLVGWSVTIPTLLMLALGIWIDSTSQSKYSWTLMLLVAGIAIGCLNAWYWIKQEGEEIK